MTAKMTKIILVAVLYGCLSPACAEDQFAKGCKLYEAKNYTQAAPLLSETVRAYPNFWPGHYYLAHTLLAQGNRTAARKEYETTLTCQPPPGTDIVNACQKVIAALGGTAPGTGTTASAAPTGDIKTDTSVAGIKNAEPESLGDKERRLHIERLKKMCSAKVASLHEEEKEAINAGMTQWVRAEDGDTRKLIIPEALETSIRADFAERVRKVQENTDRDIAAIH
jgi:tetratricopeptide (TPR) repeat protein